MGAQTLARRNWAGSGISVEPWYQSAIFYQIDPLTFEDSGTDGFGDLTGIRSRLPYLEQLGVDALVLSPLPLDPPGTAQPFDPAYGSPEDFDQLEREANAHHMRMLVDLPLDLPHDQLIATARFWLSRGVAGLRLTGPAARRSEVVRELRLIAGATRILLGESGPEPAVASRHPMPRALPELTFDARLLAAQPLTPALLRAALTGNNLLSDTPNVTRSIARLGDGTHDVSIARMVAAALLLGRGAPLLYFGQELGMSGAGDPTPMQWGGTPGFSAGTPWIPMGPNAASVTAALEEDDSNSLLHWYRTLAQLHHTQTAVRTGALEVLQTSNPNLVAWLRRPRNGSSPSVLVVVNLSQFATVTPLSSLLPLRGATAKMLLTTSSGAASDDSLSVLPVEAYGVLVAEVRTGSGLESTVLPARSRSHRPEVTSGVPQK